MQEWVVERVNEKELVERRKRTSIRISVTV